MKKKRKIALMILNLAVACMGIHGFMLLFRSGQGTDIAVYYTEQSNLLAVCACLMAAGCFFFDIPRPRWLQYFLLTAATDMMLTFCVVMSVLAPQLGFTQMLLRGHMLYHHLLCPLLCLAAAILSFRLDFAPADGAAVAIWPTLLYAGVTVCLNAFGVMDGPYPFLRLHSQSIGASLMWYFLILGAAWGLAMLITKANHSIHPSENSTDA